LLHQAIVLGVLALIAALAAVARRRAWPPVRLVGFSILVGVGLFAVPAILMELAKGSVDDPTRVALFSLAPVLAVVIEPHLSSASTQQPGGLAAGLIAVTGTLLVFPLELPQTLHAALAFVGIVAAAGSVAAANCLGVLLACEENGPSMLNFAAIAAGAGALILAVMSVPADHRTLSVPHVDAWSGLELAALALLFWLMRRMSAVRMTTRFLIAPLLANLIGLAFLRPGVQWRGWLGLLLIAVGAGWLLLGPQQDRDASTLKLDLS
jgi:hypothetical protein